MDSLPCALCGRQRELTFHHLIPRAVHSRKRYRRLYSKDQLRAGIDICQICHSGLHRLYDARTLADQYATLEALRADEAVRKHVEWSRKQKR